MSEWIQCEWKIPPGDEVVEFKRAGKDNRGQTYGAFSCKWNDLSPWHNIAGLWWRHLTQKDPSTTP